MDMKELKDLKDLNLDAIADVGVRRCVVGLLNIIQQQGEYTVQLQEENRRLRDEIARLKGEQGRPKVKGNRTAGDGSGSSTNHSSEKERGEGKPRTPGAKEITVDRTVRCPVDPATLPPDAEYKGTETTVIQDVVFRRDNVAFEREKFHSPSEGKTYMGPLPVGYEGYRFGPHVRSLVLVMYYATGTSEPKLLEFLEHAGVQMSAGELSNLLTQKVEPFHQEKAEVQAAGLRSSAWQQIDDTGTRVNGVNHYCHVLGNPLYSIFQTMPAKDRPSIIAVLSGLSAPRFLVNEEMLALAAQFGVPRSVLDPLGKELPQGEVMDERAFTERYQAVLVLLSPRMTDKLLEAAALAAYRAQTTVPLVQTLLGDDARQFDGLTDERALCWVHEGRLYAKLTPLVPQFQEELATFRGRFWDYYRQLRSFREHPSAEEAARLSSAFDELFSTEALYEGLAERMSKTLAKKAELLLVLKHPELPLHNNDSELAARQRVRKRDVSFGPRTASGAKAWDTFQSLVLTAKKLGVNVYDYFSDRVGGLGQVPRLAALIRERAAELSLDRSWSVALASG